MRTYDPFVYSLGVKCFVFSSTISLQAALRRCESSARERKTDAPAQRISAVFLCIFLLLQRENAWLGVAAVVRAAPGHVKDLPSCASAQCAVLRFLQYLRFVTAGSCEHLANCQACDHS